MKFCSKNLKWKEASIILRIKLRFAANQDGRGVEGRHAIVNCDILRRSRSQLPRAKYFREMLRARQFSNARLDAENRERKRDCVRYWIFYPNPFLSLSLEALLFDSFLYYSFIYFRDNAISSEVARTDRAISFMEAWIFTRSGAQWVRINTYLHTRIPDTNRFRNSFRSEPNWLIERTEDLEKNSGHSRVDQDRARDLTHRLKQKKEEYELKLQN